MEIQGGFLCDFEGCESVFGTRYNLRRHVQSVHLGIKKFQCDICGMMLASRQTKQEHLYTHTREKPFKCPIDCCDREFRQSSQLSSHIKQHSQEGSSRPLKFTLPPCCEERRQQQRNVKLPRHPLLNGNS